MCIIVYKAHSVPRPPKKILEHCFKENPDGAGYAWWDADKQTWFVKKGFMTFEKFWKSYKIHDFGDEDVVISHFRIGTSGKETPQHTHPFPVSDSFKEMEKLEYSCDNIVFHNGVIGVGSKTHSDTMEVIVYIVDPLLPHIEDEKIDKHLNYTLESDSCRWLITKKETIFMYGVWIEDEGIEYSNDTYKIPRKVITPYQQYGMYSHNLNNEYRNIDGTFDWRKWQDGGSAQENLPWKAADTIAPSEDETDGIIVADVLSKEIVPEVAYNDHKASELLCCPNCFHDKYLDDSPFNVGDTICLICGCVYDEFTGVIHMFDEDVHKEWKERVNELTG